MERQISYARALETLEPKTFFFQQEFEECDSNHIQATAASTDLGDL